MLRRRQLLLTGAIGSVLGAASVPQARGDDQPAPTERAVDRLVTAVADLRRDLRDERGFVEIAGVRDAQKQFLRTNGKLPDYVDVGIDTWFQVHDWHIRWQLPMQQGRDGQGRMTLMLNQTVVVLRTDVVPAYVGIPYDAR